MQCPKCQTELREGMKFCTNCGCRMETEQAVKTPAAPVQTAVLKKKKPIKEIVITVVIALFSIILGISLLFAFSNPDTRAMKKVLKNKDITGVQTLYSQASNDAKKRSAYDEALTEYVREIYNDLNNRDFEDEAIRMGASAVTDYLKTECGSLVTQSYEGGLARYMNDANSDEWEKLQQLIDSKIDYCVGVMNYKGEGKYEDAIAQFANVSQSDASYTKAKQYLDECIAAYIEQIMAQADTYMQNDDFGGCLSLLKSAEEFLTDAGVSAEQIQTKMNEATLAYAEKYVQKAEEAFLNKDVDGAIGNMEAALELQPNNGDYQAKLTEYKTYEPMKMYLEKNILETVELSSWSAVWEKQTIEANNGTVYKNCLKFAPNITNMGHFLTYTYILEGKYDTVSGTLFLPEEDKNEPVQGYFEAYGDGKLLYTSETIKSGVLPIDFSFSVTGVYKLELLFYGGDNASTIFNLGSGNSYAISNLSARKNPPTQ